MAKVHSHIAQFTYIRVVMMFLYSLLVAEMCTASALISIGAVLGKTNPVHLVLIALLEVSGFVLNGWLLQSLLNVNAFEVFHPHSRSSDQPYSHPLHAIYVSCVYL